ncbi:MAG: CbtA family protein [Actinomycetota bacterium]|nr:CbtA family protein [Actinomycetota bacterium]
MVVRSLIARGAMAGAVAGVVSSVWSVLLVEPVLQRAIELEGAGDGPVSRPVQRLVGLPTGTVLVGVALGVLFALVYRAVPSRVPPWPRSLGLALGAFLALVLVPQLVYPGNPPGVGSPDTIGQRTGSYLVAVLLGVTVVVSAYAAVRDLAARGVSAPVRHTAVTLGAGLAIGVGYALLPPFPDPVDAPASLVWQFRVLSWGGQALLFVVLGAVFGVLTGRADQPATGSPATRLLV